MSFLTRMGRAMQAEGKRLDACITLNTALPGHVVPRPLSGEGLASGAWLMPFPNQTLSLVQAIKWPRAVIFIGQ